MLNMKKIRKVIGFGLVAVTRPPPPPRATTTTTDVMTICT